MRVLSVELFDFRNYEHAELAFNGGLTAILGANGQGKTNLLESIGVSGGLGSIRGTPQSGLVRQGADSAALRCQIIADNEREILIETEIFSSGRSRLRINRQNVSRPKDLVRTLALTVFSPDDLMLVKGAPTERRRWMDDALTVVDPEFRFCRAEMERILRQRNALLKQVSKRYDSDSLNTLDIWDDKLAEVGDEIRRSRMRLIDGLAPKLNTNYEHMTGKTSAVTAEYVSSWGDESLSEALLAARKTDLRRTVSTVGPHRDDVDLLIGGMPARTHASQGEQRSLALVLRLAVDDEVREHRQVRPVLLLDDVFSELDAARSAALIEALPHGQRILTSTNAMLPEGARPEQIVHVHDGTLKY